MAKFVTLAELAQQLGVTAEEVNEMRLRQEIYGYRDGTSWKFKPDDVEQLIARRHGSGSSAEMAFDPEGAPAMDILDSQELGDAVIDLPIDVGDEDEPAEDVVLLSEFELGESGPSTSSTVIGKPGDSLSLDSDVKLVSDVDLGTGTSSTMIGAPGAPQRPGESDVKLKFEEERDSPSATMIGKPGAAQGPGESAVKVATPGAPPSPSSTVIGKPGQPLKADESAVRVSAFEDEIEIEGDLPGGMGESGIDLVTTGGSSVGVGAPPAPGAVDSGITLADEHSDEDFVLGGTGSDITISPGDSGISLLDPSDSGLSLDAPIDLASGGEGAFELAGSGEDLGAATDFDSDEVMELKTEDEFLLTPMAAEGEEESEDSGSQVIALESEASFADSEGGMFAEEPATASTMLEEDLAPAGSPLGGALLGGAPAAALGGPAAAAAGEAPYPTWVIALLSMCFIFLSLSGMMMYDLVRNIWSWNGPYSVNSTIMDTILGLFG